MKLLIILKIELIVLNIILKEFIFVYNIFVPYLVFNTIVLIIQVINNVN